CATTAAAAGAAGSPGTTYARYTGNAASSSTSTVRRSPGPSPSSAGSPARASRRASRDTSAVSGPPASSRLAAPATGPHSTGSPALGGPARGRAPGGPAGEALVLLGQRPGAGRVHEQPGGRGQGVVPGGARAGPVGWQFLVAAEDLLGDHPGATGFRGQPLEV